MNKTCINILLITAPDKLKTGKVKKPPFGIQPLGILYLESYLKKFSSVDVQVKVYDAYTLGARQEEIASVIREFNPDIVGVSAVTILIYDAQAICSIAKEVDKSIITVLGGPHVTSDPDSVSHEDVDFGVSGEGEETFLELVEALAGNSSVNNIKGLIRKQGTEVIINEPRKPPAHLDNIPFPNHDLMISKIYNPLPTWGTKGNFCAMVTSRGCPYHCSYCSVTETQGQKYRYHSAKNIFAEIKTLYNNYGVTEFSFRDGTFTTVKSRVYEFCDYILSEDMCIRWTCNTRANELNEDLLRKMKEAGCAGIFLGIEHGNEELMWRHKRIRKPDVTRLVDQACTIGLDIQGYFMLGMPDEHIEDILETIKYAKSLNLNTAAFAIATPLPSTKFYRECKEKGMLIHEEWNRYDGRLGLTWKHPTISAKEMRRLVKKCYRSFYLRPKIVLERIKRLKNPRQLLDYAFLAWQFLK